MEYATTVNDTILEITYVCYLRIFENKNSTI
jgi:hypothetical protein